MVTASGPEARRSIRVLLNLPIELQGDGGAVRARTVVVNRHGAMVLSPSPFGDDELLRIRNVYNGEKALCRVVWCGGEDLPGLFKLGVEILGEASPFWSPSYEVAVGRGVAPRPSR